jgi:hypothetical protein
MTKNVVWLVVIKGCSIDLDTIDWVYRVYADRELAEQCAAYITAQKHDKKFAGIWVDDVWIFEKYVIHDEATP